ncbi:proline-rich receptor-like protein kinase PERK14 [Megalobrama amblycephala]|uniref:proline-rich receptor-like protein kinase PERK14 n=1 Tax=Megalobrama amblycephala TaxID=75352 RepID=UPI0020144710|nr:proline-rich receptor-like protein kinase PERK14 [Megalobrama amblycephala]
MFSSKSPVSPEFPSSLPLPPPLPKSASLSAPPPLVPFSPLTYPLMPFCVDLPWVFGLQLAPDLVSPPQPINLLASPWLLPFLAPDAIVLTAPPGSLVPPASP